MKQIIEKLKEGISSQNPTETEAIARALAEELPADTVLALHGDLGVGKTTFIRGLARGWEISEPVTSPTYNLYSIYQGTRQLIHLDAYRLDASADLETLMIDDFLKSPWCFAVEWPERISTALPDETWHLYLTIDPNRTHRILLNHISSSE